MKSEYIIYVLTALNTILTIVYFYLFLRKKPTPQKLVYKQKPLYMPTKKQQASKPRFRARAPSNTELYEREVFGDKKKD
jgi:hypothetical protein